MIITLKNIKRLQEKLGHSVIKRSRFIGSNTKPTYILNTKLTIELSNNDIIIIPKGFIWDLSSVPRFLWGLLPPDGDFELASLIHDYLYIHKKELNYSRKFADDEMLLWSKVVSGTEKRVTMRNFDNQARYIAVRIFGGLVWRKK